MDKPVQATGNKHEQTLGISRDIIICNFQDGGIRDVIILMS